MAAKKDAKVKKQGGGMAAMLPKIFGVVSIICAAILFAATLDIGQLGLGSQMGVLSTVPLGLYVALGLAAIFMAPKAAVAAEAGGDAAGLADFQSKTASRFAQIENSLDMMSGHDKETLVAENKKLKEELDAIHQTERDKVDNELDFLRKQNEELEAQIKTWARKTLETAVSGNDQQAA